MQKFFKATYDSEKQNIAINDLKHNTVYNVHFSLDQARKIFGKSLKGIKSFNDVINLPSVNSVYHDDISKFFQCLANKDYQECYRMRTSINTWCDVIFNALTFDIERYSDKKKAGKNTVYLSTNDMIVLIKMIIKMKFIYPLFDTSLEETRRKMNYGFYYNTDEERNILNQIFNIVKLQIQKTELFNVHIWRLFKTKYGYNNMSFVMGMYNKTINEFFYIYDLFKDVNPLGFISSFLDNQIRWWIGEFHPEIRIIDTESSSLNETLLSINTNENQDIYSEIIVHGFIKKFRTLFRKLKSHEDPRLRFTEEELEFYEDETILMSIVSKISSSYVLSKILNMEYNSIFKMIMNNRMHKSLLLILKKTIEKYEMDHINTGFNNFPTFGNIFTIMFTYYKIKPSEVKTPNAVYNKYKLKFSRRMYKVSNVCKKYLNDIEVMKDVHVKKKLMDNLYLIDSELTGLDIHYMFKAPFKTIVKNNRTQHVKLNNLYEDERCKIFILDLVNYLIKGEIADYSFKTTFDNLRGVMFEWIEDYYTSKKDIELIKENALKGIYEETEILDDISF